MFTGKVAGYKIYFFFETCFFKQIPVIGEVVIHHGHHRPVFISFNLNPVTIKDAESFGADDRIQVCDLCPIEMQQRK